MPKGMKSAPPQQSKLQEMWGKKKAPAAASSSNSAEPAIMPSSGIKLKAEGEQKEDAEMADSAEVPEVKPSSEYISILSFPGLLIRYSSSQQWQAKASWRGIFK
jgi:hypothetical protein